MMTAGGKFDHVLDGPQDLLPGGMHVISLGAWCHVKGAIREMGLDQASLPFDWVRCSIDGVLDALRTDFRDFCRYQRVFRRGDAGDYHPHRFPMSLNHERVFLCEGRSFWHDHLDDPGEVEKYGRRIQRMRNLRERSGEGIPLLFVRAVNTTRELAAVEELQDLLVDLFGSRSHLLLLLHHQLSHTAIFFLDRPLLIVHTLGRHRVGDGITGARWLTAEAIGVAFRYMRGAGPAVLPRGQCETFVSLSGFFSSRRLTELMSDGDFGTDLSLQYTPHPVPSDAWPDQHASFNLLDLPGFKRSGHDMCRDLRHGSLHAPSCANVSRTSLLPLPADVPAVGAIRRNSSDEHLYDMFGLLRACGGQHSRSDIEAFWRDECEGSRQCGLPPDPALSRPVGELRWNPHDGHVYNRQGLHRACAQWEPGAVGAYWKENCIPIRVDGSRNGSLEAGRRVPMRPHDDTYELCD